jgi:hypothetical protein
VPAPPERNPGNTPWLARRLPPVAALLAGGTSGVPSTQPHMNVAELVSRFSTAVGAVEADDAHKAAVAVMQDLKSNLDGVANALS